MYRQAHYDEDFLNQFNTGNDFYMDDVEDSYPEQIKRKSLKLPDVRSVDVSRHFTRLSEMNYSVDLGMYPLGSCTMKFNPKYADVMEKALSVPEDQLKNAPVNTSVNRIDENALNMTPNEPLYEDIFPMVFFSP